MYKVVILGLGGIGFRYAEGLLKTDISVSLEIFDINQERLRIVYDSLNVMNQNPEKLKIIPLSLITEISNDIDLLMLCTTAKGRFELLLDMIGRTNIRNLIIEKVVFQSPDEYLKFQDILKLKMINCWVNLPRRVYPFYQKLKQSISNSQIFNCTYTGGNWGLACNALHFLDLFSYLQGTNEIDLKTDFLDPEIRISKRPGYIEFTGTILGKIGKADFMISSFNNDAAQILTITTSSKTFILLEGDDLCIEVDKNSPGSFSGCNTKIVEFQSEITNQVVEDILKQGCCSLPKYEEIISTHMLFVQKLLQHYNTILGQHNIILPIT